MKKSESAKQTEALDNNILVGYVRRSNAGGALKLSINTAAFADCSTYMTSDGQSYVPLVISMSALQKVLSGERAVTTVTNSTIEPIRPSWTPFSWRSTPLSD